MISNKTMTIATAITPMIIGNELFSSGFERIVSSVVFTDGLVFVSLGPSLIVVVVVVVVVVVGVVVVGVVVFGAFVVIDTVVVGVLVAGVVVIVVVVVVVDVEAVGPLHT